MKSENSINDGYWIYGVLKQVTVSGLKCYPTWVYSMGNCRISTNSVPKLIQKIKSKGYYFRILSESEYLKKIKRITYTYNSTSDVFYRYDQYGNHKSYPLKISLQNAKTIKFCVDAGKDFKDIVKKLPNVNRNTLGKFIDAYLDGLVIFPTKDELMSSKEEDIIHSNDSKLFGQDNLNNTVTDVISVDLVNSLPSNSSESTDELLSKLDFIVEGYGEKLNELNSKLDVINKQYYVLKQSIGVYDTHLNKTNQKIDKIVELFEDADDEVEEKSWIKRKLNL